MEQSGVGGSDTSPAQGMEIGGEGFGLIGLTVEFQGGAFWGYNFGIGFDIPGDIEAAALGIVIDAGEFQESGGAVGGWDKILDNVIALANADEGARREGLGEGVHRGGGCR